MHDKGRTMGCHLSRWVSCSRSSNRSELLKKLCRKTVAVCGTMGHGGRATKGRPEEVVFMPEPQADQLTRCYRSFSVSPVCPCKPCAAACWWRWLGGWCVAQRTRSSGQPHLGIMNCGLFVSQLSCALSSLALRSRHYIDLSKLFRGFVSYSIELLIPK